MFKSQKKIWLVGLLCLFCLGNLFGCGNRQEAAAFYPTLQIVGDVELPVAFSYTDEIVAKIGLQSFDFEARSYQGLPLKAVLALAKVEAGSQIYFVANDGTKAAIAFDDLSENYLVFAEKGWEVLNLAFPPSANIKDLAKILVVNPQGKPALTVQGGQNRKMGQNKNDNKTYSLGQLLLEDCFVASKLEGTSTKDAKSVQLFTGHHYLSVADLLGVPDSQRILVQTTTGEITKTTAAYLELGVAQIDFVIPDLDLKIPNINLVKLD